MKVKELIEKLKEFDPDLEVGGSGHFGEILEIEDVTHREGFGNNFIEINIEYAGDEPE